MKKSNIFHECVNHILLKILRIMRITIYLLLVSILQTFANDGYSQKTRLSLDFTKTKLLDVLDEIEERSEFYLVYNEKLINTDQEVSIVVNNQRIDEILDELLRGTDIVYTITDRKIILAPALVSKSFQQQFVSGRVTDRSNLPLPGVTIMVKGTSQGTVTDFKGDYTINDVPEGGILVFSFVGMVTQEVVVGNQSQINIAMVADAIGIEEVVAIGYGTLKKSDITGSVSSVRGEDLTQMPMQRVDQALQGRASGVLVLNTAGAPGAETTIRVRGMNSINGGNNALVVIDGLQGGNLNSLNPNDIESMEILKDASATAIYGARGANGVILITTKSGKKGKPVISYNYSYGIQSIRDKLDLMGAADYARTRNAWRATQNASGTPSPIFTDEEITGFELNGGTDWQDEIYRVAPIQNHQLSLGGGTENMTYMVSGAYLDQEGILLNSEYKRFNLRVNLSAEISEKLHFGLNWDGAKETGSSPPYGGGSALSFLGQAVNIAPRWDPTTPPYDENGNYNRHPVGYGAFDTWNPLAAAVEPDIKNNTVRNNLNTFLEYEIIQGLKLKVTGGATVRNIHNKSYYNSLTWEGKPVGGKLGYGTLHSSVFTRYQNSNILTYSNNWNRVHDLTIVGVGEQQFEKLEDFGLVASKFTVDQTGINDLGGADQISEKYSHLEERVINSFLGRINYAYANKYLLTATYRADGSSVFGDNNKWGYFPSVSLAWRGSEESFIKDWSLFSNLKLRGSWGITGNQAISPYQTIASMESGFNYPYNGGSSTNLGFRIAGAQNPNLKWESTEQLNFGIDVGLFDSRINATVDWYKKTTEDLLLNRTLPSYTGLRSVIDNVGSVENKGVEIALTGDPLVGAFKWNTGINISWNRNEVLDLGENDRLEFRTTYGGYGLRNGFMQLRVGEPFGQMYGYETVGTWKQSEAAEAAKFGQLPGDIKYTDVNNDGKITPSDIKAIGNSIPDFIFGFTNRFSYKGFELTALIQGSKGNDIFNQGRIRLEGGAEGTSVRLLDRWTPENQDTDVPAFIDEQTRLDAALVSTIQLGRGDEQRLSRWVEDASYIRLKNITLAYNIPSSLLNEWGIGHLKAYVSATNLITFTNYSGYDPEVSSYNSNDAQIGVDLSNYPTAKTFTFGIDVSF
ncbi:SusC/RagA family TonB-linked outer membrane protein [Maribellus luteus]|uniref:SusC/RagA family TonB-linked outer membrane protein n=2 Tax=Maribellus luteus TaxID=2305463 RepID=A0A399STW5_9BACT|nr:SusC/RagA family TonB-linked outer membrane protein [Maribellus luteus]